MSMCRGALLAALLSLPLIATAREQNAPRWIEANGVSLRYELSGRGSSTVVLLHEIGMTLESWDGVMPALTSTSRVLRYDLRGFGESEKIRGAVSLDDEVADLAGVLDRLAITRPVTLVGGALGASIALRFAARYPERTAGLVLISPIFNVSLGARQASMPPAPAAAPPRTGLDPATAIEQGGIRAYLTAQQLEALYPSVLRTDPQRWRRFLGIEYSGDPASRAATLRMVSGSADQTEDLKAVRCPSLVVATALFALRKPESIAAIAAVIPGARFQALQTGHLAALESPELVGPLLRDFVRALAH